MAVIARTTLALSCFALLVLSGQALAQEESQAAPLLGSATTDQVYTPVTPCRFVDGINAADRVTAAANSTTARYYKVRGSTNSDFVSQGAAGSAPSGCGIPTSATAVMVNLTVADPDQDGDLRVDAAHVLTPSTTSVLNYTFGGARGKNLANGIVVPLCDLSVSACASGATPTSPTRDILVTFHAGASTVSTYFIADVLGYFAPAPLTGLVTSVNAITGAVTIAPGANVTVAQSGGTLTIAASGATAVTASAPLASSGGSTPNISLSGAVPVANGGTGNASLTANGVLYGQGTGALGNAVGVAGQVLTGTDGAPAWTGSPSLIGNLTLSPSTASVGNILKGANRFIHNSGSRNTFIGENAGNFTMGGIENTAIGESALRNNTGASLNTAIGRQALFSTTLGEYNTAIGWFALGNNTTGNYNTAIGKGALGQNTTGGYNTAIGIQAGDQLTTGGLNIYIGAFANGVAGESNTIRIGTTSQNRAFIAGIRGVTTGVADAVAVLVDSNGQLGTVNSSRRFKADIADMDTASAGLMKLRPVTFHYKSDQNPVGRTLQYGLIAEEVALVYPGLVARSAEGQIETVLYQFLPPMLLNEVQKQQRTIQAQAGEIQRQAAELASLKQQTARIAVLEEQVLEIAALKRQSAKMAAALERLGHVDVAGR